MRKLLAVIVSGVVLASCSGEPVREVDNKDAQYGTFSSSVDSKRSEGADTYDAKEITEAANKFFGENSESFAKAIERALSDFGQPNAYIAGDEGAGAVVVGLRYGKGVLTYKGGDSQTVYWQSPSIGWDFGGNASKVFTLVYNLRNTKDLFQRFPAVDGSLYLLAGVGMNYQRSGDITLAPIRTGVGLRAGANVGYVHYTRSASVIPF